MWLLIPILLFGASDADFTADKIEKSGFFNMYWDEPQGKLYLGIERFDEEFLFAHWLVTGLGSNDIGLDRGQLGGTRLVKFKRAGNKVLMIQPNLTYRALSDNAEERRAVRESFAYSVLWGTKIVAEDKDRVYVDLSDFVFRDERGVAQRLRRNKEGDYKIDLSRSYYVPEFIKSFPENTEIQTALTFKGRPSGRYVPQVAPTPTTFTLQQRYSFIKLPDNNYKPRRFHPSSGGFPLTYQDYAAPLDEDLAQLFVMRHRMELKNPDAERSEPVEPLVYYVDSGAPPQIQEALLDGARWWNQAFEAAGIINGFRVEILPEGIDPMDSRYNVIQWVHRATRGWSYGMSIRDPRTGEIIKGHVNLGSLRVRQDRLIFEGMIPADENGKYSDDPARNPVELALARIRQLSAHEIGHTLGLAHNFAASSFDRCSVMDYPAPLVTLEDGQINCSRAYAVGIGEWDKLMIRYLYGHFKDEEAGLASVIKDARDKGILFVDDGHGRSLDTMHPQAHVWDNGSDNVAEFERVMEVRNHILANFGPANMRSDKYLSRLEEALTPVYLHHRFQLNACAKSLGGAWFSYEPNQGTDAYKPVAPEKQRKALSLMLATLKPAFLDLPEHLRELIPPAASGYSAHREYFERRTGNDFDDLALAETSVAMTLDALLSVTRINRIYNQHARNSGQLGVTEYLDQLLATTLLAGEMSGRDGVLHRIATYETVNRLGDLATNPGVREDVRARIFDHLHRAVEKMNANKAGVGYEAYRRWIKTRLEQLNRAREISKPTKRLATPPGSPIGSH